MTVLDRMTGQRVQTPNKDHLVIEIIVEIDRLSLHHVRERRTPSGREQIISED